MYDARAGGFDYGLYRALKDVEEFGKYRACDEHMALINGPVKEGVAGTHLSFRPVFALFRDRRTPTELTHA